MNSPFYHYLFGRLVIAGDLFIAFNSTLNKEI